MGINVIQLWHGDYRSTVRTHSAIPTGTTGQRPPFESASSQCDPICCRAGLQVAGLASSIRQLAHHLYADESLVKERGVEPCLRTAAERADSAHQGRGGIYGQRYGQGAPRWYGCVKKNGPQSIGKSRGGWTTKIHMVAADARTAMTFSLSPGTGSRRAGRTQAA